MAWNSFIEPAGWTLLHFLWQGLIVGALHELALYAAARRSPRLRYALSMAALTTLAALPVLTFTWLWAPPAAAPALLKTVHAVAMESDSAMGTGSLINAWLPWVVALWMTGVAAMTLRFCAGLLALNRLAANADHDAVAEWIVAELDRLRERMGIRRSVRVALSLRVTSPLVIGWVKPVILLPLTAVTGLDQHGIRMVLAHELAHLRRYDHLVNLVQVVVETLLFYHPAVHRVSRSLRREREQCCDDMAAAIDGNALAYARVLAELEEIRQGVRGHALALGIAEEELYTRIQRLAGVMPTRRERNHWLPAAGLVLLALLALRPLPDISAPLLPALFETTADTRKRVALALPPADTRPFRPIAAPLNTPSGSTGTTPQPQPEDPPSRSEEAKTTTSLPDAQNALPETDPAQHGLPLSAAPAETSPALPKEPVASSSTDATPIAQDNEEFVQEVIETGGGLLHAEEPVYPRRALRAGREGEVLLAFTITPAGHVEDVEVIDATPRGYFESAARNAVSQWRFTPFTENGKPVARRVTQAMEFRLGGHSGDGSNDLNPLSCEERTGTRLCRADPVETTLTVMTD